MGKGSLLSPLLTSSFIFSLSLGCGKSSDDNEASGSSSKASLRIAMVAGGASSSNTFNLADVPFTGFQNGSIASGSPDEMTLSIVKMTLKNSTTGSGIPIFNEPAGKPLTITGSRIDISSFFTKIECVKADGTVFEVPEGKTCKCGVDASGNLIDQVETTADDGSKKLSCPAPKEGETPPFAVVPVDQTGEYDVLTVEFLNKGEAKGCVTGKFASGTSTYCTKTGKDLDSAAATAADFPSSGATTSTVYWSKGGKGLPTFNKDYPIGSSISITTEGESPKLTFLIDRGRLLRFFNGTATQGPNSMLPGNQAYFFSTVFEDSSYVFVGQPGDIRGYRYAAYVIGGKTINDSFPAAGSRTCVPGNGVNCTYVNGWMTIIEDKDGKPFAVSLMPDDDNAFTVSKGANSKADKPGALDASKITVNSDSTWTLQYSLSQPNSTKGLSGSFFNLDPSKAVGTTQTIEMQAEFNDTQPTNPFRTWGNVTLQRAL